MDTAIFQFCGCEQIDVFGALEVFEKESERALNLIINESAKKPVPRTFDSSHITSRQKAIINEGKNVSFVDSVAERDILFNWGAFFHFDFERTVVSGGFVVQSDRSLSRVDEIARVVSFEYGYATIMDTNYLNPWLYLGGIAGGGSLVTSGPEYEKRIMMGRWGTHQYGSHERGLIRAIYEKNYFGTKMLKSVIKDKPLEKEIEDISGCGLDQLSPTLLVLSVPREQCNRVMEELRHRVIAR
tara:strand:+ start:21221 stop:21946 length:726 start_codon:yes stop_codon:yes gene_type:complete